MSWASVPPILEVTSAAVSMIKTLIKNEAQPSCLHISVQGGGCSGFEYVFSVAPLDSLDDAKKQNVLLYDEDGSVLLAIDQNSLQYIKGATLDYVDQLIRSNFAIIKNPNSTSGCGCGSSFSVF